MTRQKTQPQSFEAHWRTVAVTIILGLLSWQATKVVTGQEELIVKLNELTVTIAELKVRLDTVATLNNDLRGVEHRVTILEQRIRQHEMGVK